MADKKGSWSDDGGCRWAFVQRQSCMKLQHMHVQEICRTWWGVAGAAHDDDRAAVDRQAEARLPTLRKKKKDKSKEK